MREQLSKISTWGFIAISIFTTVYLIVIALLNPLSEHYTLNNQWGYITMSLAGTIGYILAMLSISNKTVRMWSILVIELYLFGLLFQLFALISQ